MADEQDARTHKRVKIDYAQCSEDDGPSDFKLICDGQILSVHKARLCKSSEFFEKAFTVDMKESLEGEMTVLEKDCRIVAAVIYWMYYGIYDDGFANDPTVAVSREKFNAQVYALAEEWKIQALKDLATKKVMVLLGDRKPSRHFLDAIEVVYRATPSHDRGLRALLSAHAGRFHRGLLQDDDGFVEKLDQVAGFGKDVVEAMSARYRRYMCCFTNCKAVFEWPADEVKNLAGCPFCLYEYNGKHRPKPAP